MLKYRRVEDWIPSRPSETSHEQFVMTFFFPRQHLPCVLCLCDHNMIELFCSFGQPIMLIDLRLFVSGRSYEIFHRRF